MGKNANTWVLASCKFAQAGQLGINFDDPGHPLPGDIKTRVAEAFDLLINEGISPEFETTNYKVQPGSRGSMWEPPEGPSVEDYQGYWSLEGKNVIDMNMEAGELKVPVDVAHRMFQQALPVKVKITSSTKVPMDRYGEYDMDMLVKGDVMITGIGPLQPDGRCQFTYAPEPIPMNDYDYV